MAKNAKGQFVSSRPSDAPVAPVAIDAPTESQWTREELMRVKHLGPGIIGREMYDAAQAIVNAPGGGALGPAILTHDDPRYHQGAPSPERLAALREAAGVA